MKLAAVGECTRDVYVDRRVATVGGISLELRRAGAAEPRARGRGRARQLHGHRRGRRRRARDARSRRRRRLAPAHRPGSTATQRIHLARRGTALSRGRLRPRCARRLPPGSGRPGVHRDLRRRDGAVLPPGRTPLPSRDGGGAPGGAPRRRSPRWRGPRPGPRRHRRPPRFASTSPSSAATRRRCRFSCRDRAREARSSSSPTAPPAAARWSAAAVSPCRPCRCPPRSASIRPDAATPSRRPSPSRTSRMATLTAALQAGSRAAAAVIRHLGAIATGGHR